uniref:Putative secreted protein n=1 Tax=Panstrongylus lignarius TaxID=156445 RepID=A0A224Y4W6_9HEMI
MKSLWLILLTQSQASALVIKNCHKMKILLHRKLLSLLQMAVKEEKRVQELLLQRIRQPYQVSVLMLPLGQ